MLNAAIEDMFSEDGGVVTGSSIHRMKGAEADTCYFIGNEKLPITRKNQQEWQYAQEENLVYVGLSRSLNEMNFVKEDEDTDSDEWDESDDYKPKRTTYELLLESIKDHPTDIQAIYIEQFWDAKEASE